MSTTRPQLLRELVRFVGERGAQRPLTLFVDDVHWADPTTLDALEALLHEFPDLRRQFQRILSREIVRSTEMMQLLGGMCAEKRVATFLLDLTQRLRERGAGGQAGDEEAERGDKKGFHIR